MFRVRVDSRAGVIASIFFVLPMMLFAPLVASAQQGQKVSVGFLTRMPDAEVAQVLESHNAAVTRAYIWSSGFSGSHTDVWSAGQGVGAEEFIRRARQESINFFEKAIEGNTYRLRTIVESRDREDAIYDQEFGRNLRSILMLRSQFESALAEARNGSALIYAVDVEINAENAAALRVHPSVRASIEDGERSTMQQLQDLKPVEFDNSFEDNEIRMSSNEALYARALDILGN